METSAQSKHLIGRTINNLRIDSLIGKGGMGEVYKAEHLFLKTWKAVKRLDPEFSADQELLARFRREAESQAVLESPNIVKVTDLFQVDGQFFLVMDYVEGEDLRSWLKRESKPGIRKSIEIIKGVLNGLAAAHRRQIIHRDIKPANVLIDREGNPHITDFGIALISSQTRLTRMDTFVGSSSYASPEQITATDNIDCRTDIYSAGILFYRLLTGELPFTGDSHASLAYQHIHQPIPNPTDINPEIPKALSDIVMRAAAKPPSDRFQSGEEFLAAIAAYEASTRKQAEEDDSATVAVPVRGDLVGHTINDLQFESRLGSGGMGEVFVARHLLLNKKVAVKRLAPWIVTSPESRERFRREAESQASLNHPNLVRAINFFEYGGQFFLVMDYVEGQDLGSILKEKKTVSEQQALKIIKGVLRGLNAAHSRKVVHRDVKPENILIDADGVAYITDFGIAFVSDVTRMTQNSGSVGTPLYMSPEQIETPGTVDHRSDIYSTSILLYRLLTGELPFKGNTQTSLAYQHVHTPLPNPRVVNPRLSVNLANLIIRGASKDPKLRFQSSREYLQAIEAYERGPYSVKPSANSPWQHFGWMIGALATIAFSGAALFLAKEGDLGPSRHHDQEAAAALIDTTARTAKDYCRYQAELSEKESAMAAAKSAGELISSALIDQLQSAIDTKRTSMRQVESDYRRSLTALQEMDADIVRQRLRDAEQMLIRDQNGVQLRYVHALSANYDQVISARDGMLSQTVAINCSSP